MRRDLRMPASSRSRESLYGTYNWPNFLVKINSLGPANHYCPILVVYWMRENEVYESFRQLENWKGRKSNFWIATEKNCTQYCGWLRVSFRGSRISLKSVGKCLGDCHRQYLQLGGDEIHLVGNGRRVLSRNPGFILWYWIPWSYFRTRWEPSIKLKGIEESLERPRGIPDGHSKQVKITRSYRYWKRDISQ